MIPVTGKNTCLRILIFFLLFPDIHTECRQEFHLQGSSGVQLNINIPNGLGFIKKIINFFMLTEVWDGWGFPEGLVCVQKLPSLNLNRKEDSRECWAIFNK